MLSLRQTPVTILLLAAIAAAFGLEMMRGATDDARALVALGANYPPAVLQQGQWWRLVTSMFLHGGFLHLFFNGWALVQLGGLFERWIGSGRLVLTYFATGICGSLASVLFTNNVSVGASGAIFGLLGALIAFLLRRRNRLAAGGKSILSQLVFWAGLNLILGASMPMIDNFAHIGGLVAGFVVGLLLRERQIAQPMEAEIPV
ncbi:MAG TPA: rhomboid family intramembrane serine protease [Thermoanaerobaculia bacterium]|nr:rhomboid family intramembrane serine protease [Thermoanaerobaculia bacterium]